MADIIRIDGERVSPDATPEAPSGRGSCSICGRPTVLAFRPFCSKRCSDVDLSRWLTGAYAIAGAGADADEDGEAAPELPPAKAGSDDKP
jgi:uncharacterized protein